MGDNNIFHFTDKDVYDKGNCSTEAVDTFVYGSTFQSHKPEFKPETFGRIVNGFYPETSLGSHEWTDLLECVESSGFDELIQFSAISKWSDAEQVSLHHDLISGALTNIARAMNRTLKMSCEIEKSSLRLCFEILFLFLTDYFDFFNSCCK